MGAHFRFRRDDIIFGDTSWFACDCADAFDAGETSVLRQPRKILQPLLGNDM